MESTADEKVWGELIRKCKPEELDKDYLKGMAQEINVNDKNESGSIAKRIVQTDQPTMYLPLFCHFKVLFKLVQIGLSVKRVKNLQRKKDAADREKSDILTKIAEEKAILKELEFHKEMRKEAQRIKEQEIKFLVNKRAAVQARLDRLNQSDPAQLFMD